MGEVVLMVRSGDSLGYENLLGQEEDVKLGKDAGRQRLMLHVSWVHLKLGRKGRWAAKVIVSSKSHSGGASKLGRDGRWAAKVILMGWSTVYKLSFYKGKGCGWGRNGAMNRSQIDGWCWWAVFIEEMLSQMVWDVLLVGVCLDWFRCVVFVFCCRLCVFNCLFFVVLPTPLATT